MRVTYIELLDQRHPMCFSLAASEALDEAFGGLERMQEELQSGSVGRVAKAADTVLAILMQAGRIYASARGEELPEKLPCRPADLIDASSKEAVQAIFSAITGGTEREVETVPKNGEAAPDPAAPRGSTTTEPGPG